MITFNLSFSEYVSNVYTTQSHTISCVLNNIPNQTKVEWTTDTMAENLRLISESESYKDGSQTSTLTLTEAQLLALKVAASYNLVHKFTCKTTVGVANIEVKTTQTIKIHSSGKYSYCLSYTV